MDNINTLKEGFINNILRVDDESLFELHLPNTYFPKGVELMHEILERLELEYRDIIEIIETSNDKEELDFYKQELEITNKKIEVVKSRIEKDKIEQQLEENISNGKAKNIIFATNRRETYIENDLKNIPEEYYDKILSCLDKLGAGYDDYSEEKQRKFGTINDKLKGICEIKEFKIRLLYKVLDEDTVYVHQVIVKKDDFARKTRETMIVRNENVSEEFENIRKIITGKQQKDIIINENKILKQKIYEILESKRRGERHV